MNKITYERLICARNIIKSYYESMCDESGYSDDKDTLNDELSIIDEMIEQHKLPTWEEVVNYWKEVDKYLNVYIHNNEFCVTDIDEEETSVFWYDIITGGYEFECFSIEMINAINLTIRYLEAQESKNQTNTRN